MALPLFRRIFFSTVFAVWGSDQVQAEGHDPITVSHGYSFFGDLKLELIVK